MSGGAEPQGEEFYDENSDGDFVTALQDGLDTYTEGDWDMEIEEGPATTRFQEKRSFVQPLGMHPFGHTVVLRGGGHSEWEDHE
jgi:hypothetical protein